MNLLKIGSAEYRCEGIPIKSGNEITGVFEDENGNLGHEFFTLSEGVPVILIGRNGEKIGIKEKEDDNKQQSEIESALMELAEIYTDTQAAILEIGGKNNG